MARTRPCSSCFISSSPRTRGREAGDADTERVLASDWQIRLQALLRAHPEVIDELRRVLHTRLTPSLDPEEQARVGAIVMRAEASGGGRMYQAGRDQHITEK
ncbi:hypothetical protein GCM10009544_03390 [Streptomyces stramineus]|uniref:TipAS antibiotic-recognition domain-containing protein n=1 Tax=Streptomyces stramineus TaxID=173861 RepID=A0ABN0ZDS3_9ACTN